MNKYHLYIILTRTNTVISKLIQFIKKDEYTHAAISLDKELNYMYGFGRKYAYNPFLGRFRHEGMDEGVYKFYKVVPGVILELEVSREQYENAKELLGHFIANRDHYKYNYQGLLHAWMNRSICCEDRFLCSEFVYHILKESGVTDLKVSRNLVRPQSLLQIQGNIIYEGNLKELESQNNYCNTKIVKVNKLSTAYE